MRGLRARAARHRSSTCALGAALAAAVLVAACSSPAGRSGSPPPGPGIVVTSFNFDESRLLGEIYAQALETAGFDVRRELGLGPRELVLPALQQGHVDIVPEYLGALADAVAPEAAASDPATVLTAVDEALSQWDAGVLEPSAASNQNALVVTRATATEHDLSSISDLAPLAAGLTLAGPPECPMRDRCLIGLERAYGLQFEGFLALERSALVQQSLLDGVTEVGVLFTTDGVLATRDLVVLDDDRRLQPAENVVPAVRRDVVTARASEVLDDVSAHLTTAGLRVLNWRVASAGGDVAAEAHGWLVRTGLVER